MRFLNSFRIPLPGCHRQDVGAGACGSLRADALVGVHGNPTQLNYLANKGLFSPSGVLVTSSEQLFGVYRSFTVDSIALTLKQGEESSGEGVGVLAAYKYIRRNFYTTLLSLALERLRWFLFSASSCFLSKLCFQPQRIPGCLSHERGRERQGWEIQRRGEGRRTPRMVLAVPRHCSLLPLGYV